MLILQFSHQPCGTTWRSHLSKMSRKSCWFCFSSFSYFGCLHSSPIEKKERKQENQHDYFFYSQHFLVASSFVWGWGLVDFSRSTPLFPCLLLSSLFILCLGSQVGESYGWSFWRCYIWELLEKRIVALWRSMFIFPCWHPSSNPNFTANIPILYKDKVAII